MQLYKVLKAVSPAAYEVVETLLTIEDAQNLFASLLSSGRNLVDLQIVPIDEQNSPELFEV